MSKIKENDTVKVHYTGKLDGGQVFDSSREREPLEFKVGEGKLIPGFEKAVIGMEKGETKEVNIPKDNAYGDHKEELTQEVKKNDLPEDIDPKVGMELMSKTPDGREFRVFIKDVKDEEIVIDANHPLAGRDLVFEIEVVDVK